MPEQGIPTKGAIDGSVLSAAEGIFDLIDDDGLAAVGIEGGNENIGIPSAERETAGHAEEESTEEEQDDFDAEAAAALEDDDPEGDEDEEGEDESEEEDSEDEADDEDEDEAEDDDPLVTVKVDGEERQVRLSEALRSYSGEAALTRKFQAVADQRKELESAQEAQQQDRIKLDAYLRQAEELLRANLPQEPSPNDPQAWIRYQQEQQRLQQIQQKRTELHQQLAEEQSRKDAEFVDAEMKALSEEIPGWDDEVAMTTDLKALSQYALDMGFDREDVAAIKDRKVVKLLRKAKAYDEITAKTGEAKKKVKTTKTLKPGKPSRKPASKAKADRARRAKAKKLRESGNVRDAASLFEDMIGDDF